jgi:FG-GAP-like repeat/Secretion system C-terminal sorting domain
LKTFLTILLLFFSQVSFSQNLVQKFDGINFSINGNNSAAPFNGGENNARFQFVDIDGDNDLDLFMFDSDTTLYYYENTGTPQNASFKLISGRFQNLSFRNWFYFVDIDNDNDYDLFTGGEFQTVKYFRNIGTSASPSFSLIINELHSSGDTVIYSESNCVPVFCDIDGDGDKDFFTGQSLGTVTYYENIGSANNFNFRYATDFWQNLLIISPAYRIAPLPEIKKNFSNLFQHNNNNNNNNILNSTDGNRHGANSLEFVDINNDNDFDLFWGDLFSKGIYFIENNGTPNNPNVAIIDSTYPHNSPYISKGYNSTRFVDIDADGDKDLFVSVLYLSQNSNNFAFYRNDGNAFVPNFQPVSYDYLNNVDVGGNSNIRFVDIDNDGDADLFIGNDYAKLAYYQNTGTAASPSFNLITDSLPIFSSSFNYSPAFADLDNDGDMDLLLGSYIKDSIWFFRNTGTPQNFIFTFEARGRQIGLDSVGQSSNPSFVDIDNDGDKDLFIGATNGRIFFYENTGTASNFIFTFRSAYYNSIDVGDESIPRFFDIDGDGDYDLFIGEAYGKISYYKNEGNASNPNFILQTNNYKNINVNQNACPEFFDIDNDTDPDLFIGNGKGGMFYFRNDDIIGIQNISGNTPANFTLYQNYPNPFNPSTVISYSINKNSFINLKVYDLTGKEVAVLVNENQRAGTYSVNFNAGNFPSGVYFYRLSAQDFIENKKMLYIK